MCIIINQSLFANFPASYDPLNISSNHKSYQEAGDLKSLNLLVFSAILRLMNNAITGLLPNISPDFPSDIDVYSILDDIAINEQFLDSSQVNAGTLTSMEKAYLATDMARRKSQEINDTLSAVSCL